MSYELVAQLEERWPSKPEVVGSNPTKLVYAYLRNGIIHFENDYRTVIGYGYPISSEFIH